MDKMLSGGSCVFNSFRGFCFFEPGNLVRRPKSIPMPMMISKKMIRRIMNISLDLFKAYNPVGSTLVGVDSPEIISVAPVAMALTVLVKWSRSKVSTSSLT